MIEGLKQALCKLPGVGPRTAQRMAFHLLERDREGARHIAEALTSALQNITNCTRCNNFSEQELCPICASARRKAEQLCVVESPADLEAIEKAGVYQGMYFVLMGRLSPLDGVGPDDLRLEQLEQRLAEGGVQELILATNLTVEGEATAHYIGELAQKRGVEVTRIAQGVPVGGELEYIDRNTLAHAISGRHKL